MAGKTDFAHGVAEIPAIFWITIVVGNDGKDRHRSGCTVQKIGTRRGHTGRTQLRHGRCVQGVVSSHDFIGDAVGDRLADGGRWHPRPRGSGEYRCSALADVWL